MTRETLDDAIDRVAGSLTAVPHDVEAAARIDRALDVRAPRHREWLLAAAAVVLMVVGVMLVRTTRSIEPAATVNAPVAQLAAPATASPAAGTTVQPPLHRASSDAKDAAVQRSISGGDRGRASQRIRASRGTSLRAHQQDLPTSLPALSSPETLVVDDLQLETLNVLPVALDDLALLELDVPEIGSTGEDREQR